jgi:hypothetical protein
MKTTLSCNYYSTPNNLGGGGLLFITFIYVKLVRSFEQKKFNPKLNTFNWAWNSNFVFNNDI